MSANKKIFAAVAADDRDEFQTLIANDPSLAQARNEQGLSLLMWMLYQQRKGWLDEIRPLLGELDFFEAAAIGDVVRIKSLLDEQPDQVNTVAPDGFQALGLASFFAQPKVVAALIAEGADVNYQAPANQLAALHGAVAGKCAASARHLLAAGANIDARQQGGYTALMAAAANGLTEILKLLLEHDADAAITDDQGNTARDQALQKGQHNMADLLPV
ncbi:MAG: ankyrin repeat domain-containing protein [Gammaproteobacteria bacterium]